MDELDKLRRDILESETFCFYPFLEVSTRPNGVVFPCCYWNENDHLSLEKRLDDKNSLDTFWNNKKVIDTRNKISNGTKVKGCKICYRDGASSMRARSIKEHINDRDKLQIVKDTLNNEGVAKHSPKKIELKPSNLCNLKCLICNAYDSSQIEKELSDLDEKFNGIKTIGGTFSRIVGNQSGVWEGNVGQYVLNANSKSKWAESDRFWEELKILLPKIEVLSFAGGEPTLNPIVNKILTYCVETKISKNITVFISSNFTNLNPKFLSNMNNFKKFELIASIDGTEKVQEYTRFPSNWNKIKENFEEAKTYMQGTEIKILTNITVSIMNIFQLHDLFWYIDEQSSKHPYYNEWPFNINLINFPEQQRISIIPPEFRQEIIDNLNHYLENGDIIKFFPDLKIKIEMLIHELNNEWDKEDSVFQLTKLKTMLVTLDEHRKVSYKDAIPKLDEIFKEYVK